MSGIIFDIETAGKDFDSLEPAVQDYLSKWAETDEEKKEVWDSLSLYPLTAEVITIGMYNPDTNKGAVFFQNNAASDPPFDEEGIRYETGTEEEIIQKFWETIKAYRPQFAIALFEDITERRESEDKIRPDQEQLQSLASELSFTEERERRRLA